MTARKKIRGEKDEKEKDMDLHDGGGHCGGCYRVRRRRDV